MFFKLNLISLLLISSQLNSMTTGYKLSKLSNNIVRCLSSNAKTEELAVKESIKALNIALRAAGYNNFEILTINRQYQALQCAQKFCCFSRDIIDPKGTGVLRGDSKAVCLCTRHTKFDTPGHVIQARIIEHDLE